MAYSDDIQDAINRGAGVDSRPTIERGSYGDRGVLEGNRPDGVGKPSKEQPPSPPAKFANVAIDAGSPLSKHAVEISGMLGATAAYSGFGSKHPATGSPIPNAAPDDDYAQTGVKQQDNPDKDND